MHTPISTFCGDKIFAIQIESFVHFKRLREVIAPGSDLGHDFSISYKAMEQCGRSDENDIFAQGLEWQMAFVVGPFWMQESREQIELVWSLCIKKFSSYSNQIPCMEVGTSFLKIGIHRGKVVKESMLKTFHGVTA